MSTFNLHLSFFLASPSQAQTSRARRLQPQGGLQPRISSGLGSEEDQELGIW